jgi:hypothetical protein
MSNGDVPHTSDALVVDSGRERTVRSTYHRLRMVGLTPFEAGNLTAHLNGLHVAEHGWTIQEIERLLFVRALVERGRISA